LELGEGSPGEYGILHHSLFPDSGPDMSFNVYNCQSVNISGGEFNIIQGNLNRYSSNVVYATNGSHNVNVRGAREGARGGGNTGTQVVTQHKLDLNRKTRQSRMPRIHFIHSSSHVQLLYPLFFHLCRLAVQHEERPTEAKSRMQTAATTDMGPEYYLLHGCGSCLVDEARDQLCSTGFYPATARNG
jgi:hypothetical protein